MINEITNDTPVVMLTVGQLKNIIEALATEQKPEPVKKDKRYVYGIAGIANLFDCSLTTANRIKQSGKIDKAIKQIGRKIIVDADLALELAGQKTEGRR